MDETVKTTSKLNRLDETILYILSKAQKLGKPDLSRFELMKLVYLIEINAHKYIGEPFVSEVKFVRDKNGPISINVYDSAKKLDDMNLIRIIAEENTEYGYPRHKHELLKLPQLSFSDSEVVFLNSVLEDYLRLTMSKLKSIAYETEPMARIQEAEKKKGIVLKGVPINMDSVPLDEDLLESIMA